MSAEEFAEGIFHFANRMQAYLVAVRIDAFEVVGRDDDIGEALLPETLYLMLQHGLALNAYHGLWYIRGNRAYSVAPGAL